jgi:AraC-like DNA-binding protein
MGAGRFTLDPSIRALLSDLGVSTARVLRRAGLAADLFRAGPVLLTPDEYFRFWEAIDAEAEDPGLAVAIGRAISVEMFSPPIFAALCSPNLGVAATRIATYKQLVAPGALDLASRRAGLTVTYRWPAAMTPPQLLTTAEIIFWVALARIATRYHVRPLQATARWLPADPDSVADYLGAPLRKGPTESLTFSAEDAARPFLTENAAMWRFFAPELRRRLADLEAEVSAAERVRAALLETLPAGDSTMSAVTHRLATSPRTLQRQLQLEGTNFLEVLADTRAHLARHYLAHSTMTTAEIAYMLAYDDTNSFYRAFKSWTGSTPDMVRSASPAAAVAPR